MSGLIYLVDDEPAVCEVTRRMLERAGYTVETMDTGAAATTALRAHQADLVLLDVALPDGNGLQLCRRLKADPVTAQVPIVIVTGWGSSAVCEEAAAAGASCVLPKPFSIADLHTCVAQNLTRNRHRTN